MANGLFAGGDGTELNPYLIEDAHDLNAIRNGAYIYYYKLVNDIDMSIEPYGSEGFLPIQLNKDFNIDGNGYKIFELYIVGTNPAFIYKQGAYHTGTIKNLSIFGSPKQTVDIILVYNLAGISSRPQSWIYNCVIGDYITLCRTVSGGSFANVRNLKLVGKRYQQYLSVSSSTSLTTTNAIGIGQELNPATSKGISGGTHYTNCYFDLEVYDRAYAATKGITPKTTAQMKTAQTFIDAGFDTELNDEGSPVWILEDGKYPKLWFEVEALILIKSNDKYYYYQNDEFIEVEPTQENFEEFNVDLTKLLIPNIQGVKPLMTLDNPEIIHLTGKENPKLHIKGFRNLIPLMVSESPKLLINTDRENSPIIKTKSIPQGQLILPTKDIHVKLLRNIQSFTVSTVGDITGIIRLIFSINSGLSWQTLDSVTGQFKTLDNIKDFNEVKAEGMTIETFNSIGLRWNEVIKGMSVRFGYYLEIEEMNDIASIDKLEVIMDVLGSWEALMHEIDYDYEYDNEKIYIELYRDGSYKINYI